MKTVDMQVVDIRKIMGDSKIKAFADLKIGGSLIVKGFKVVNGSNGVFISMPSRPGKDGKWVDTFMPLNDEVKREIEGLVLEAYDRETDCVKN